MKPLAAFITALSLLGSYGISQAFADTDEGAKGLFFEQLDHQSNNLNTGIQYWIELHHNGETIHATNKTAFHTGDKIRFHVRPNIDGFAYIMLKSGSRGEQAVLFPAKGRDENNKITHGKEIVLPDDGMLSFDENPGTEKLTLLVSRKPIDTEAYLSGKVATPDGSNLDDTTPKLVAMSSSGSKDLIPNQVLVAYLPTSVGASETVKAAAAKASRVSAGNSTAVSESHDANSQKISNSSKNDSASKSSKSSKSSKTPMNSTTSMKSKTSISSKNERTSTLALAPAPSKSSTETQISSRESREKTSKTHTTSQLKNKRQSLAKGETENSNATPGAQDNTAKAGLVTVVFKNPDCVLAADISLEHLKD